MTKTAPYTETICEGCGGSGEIETTIVVYGWDNTDQVEDSEVETCTNCAGTGWEPPAWKDDGSEDDAEGSGFVEPPDDSV